MREVILAADFDGTLYPILENDSEQILALKSALWKREPEEITSLIARDKERALSPRKFNEGLESLIKGIEGKIIEETVNEILKSFDSSALDPLRDIASQSFVHFSVLSCGTDLLIKSFLEKTGLDIHTEYILSKELTLRDGKLDHYIYHITDIRDKAECIRRMRARYKDSVVVALGDGPTDAPMLDEADFPYIISWNESKREWPYPVIRTFEELKKSLAESGLIR